MKATEVYLRVVDGNGCEFGRVGGNDGDGRRNGDGGRGGRGGNGGSILVLCRIDNSANSDPLDARGGEGGEGAMAVMAVRPKGVEIENSVSLLVNENQFSSARQDNARALARTCRGARRTAGITLTRQAVNGAHDPERHCGNKRGGRDRQDPRPHDAAGDAPLHRR